MGGLTMSADMKVVIVSVFLISFAVSGFVPREPTKQDIDIARLEFSKLRKSSLNSFKVVAAEDTTEDNSNGDDLDDANDTIPILVGAVLAAMILVVMVSYFVLRVRANKKGSS